MTHALTSPTAATLLLPDRNFIAKPQATSPGTLLHCSSLFVTDPFGAPNPVLAGTPLANCEWSTLYAYMHRRFGPPNGNSETETDASPSWVLTTPDTSLFLVVCPSVAGAAYSFKPCLVLPADQAPPATAQALRDVVDAQGRIEAIKDAYQTSLLDLLRPVAFGPFDITAIGNLDEDSLLGNALEEFDVTNKKYVFIVDPSEASRVAVPNGVLGSASWPSFHKIIFELGAGDCGAGFSKAVEQLR